MSATIITKKRTKKREDQDTPWKNILQVYFRDFMEFCLSEIAQQIDWTRGYESLDKELSAIARYAKTGNRLVDKLMKVWMKGGDELWILIHIEVQGNPDHMLEERMFVYRYRLRDFYKRPIISIAILTDGNPGWRPNEYEESYYGCSLSMRYLVVKILDYADKRQELEAMNNPFATVILAQLAVLKTRKNPQARYDTKLALTRKLYEKGWDREDVLQLYTLIDWLIALPKELMLNYHKEITHIEEEQKMAYITTAERIGMQKGIAQAEANMEKYVTTAERIGMQKGIAQAEANMEKYVTTAERIGMQKGETNLLIRLLKHRFGDVPTRYLKRIQAANLEVLHVWEEQFLDAKTLEDVFK